MERSITATIYKSSTHEKSKIQQNPDSRPFPLNSDKRTQINTNHSFILCSSTKIFKSQYHWLDKHCTQIQSYTQYNVHKYTLKKSNFRSKFVQKSLKEIFYTFSSATKCLNTLWSFHMHKLSNRHTRARAHTLTNCSSWGSSRWSPAGSSCCNGQRCFWTHRPALWSSENTTQQTQSAPLSIQTKNKIHFRNVLKVITS